MQQHVEIPIKYNTPLDTFKYDFETPEIWREHTFNVCYLNF